MLCRRAVLYDRILADPAMHHLRADSIDGFAALALPEVADVHIQTLQEEVEGNVAAYRRVISKAEQGARKQQPSSSCVCRRCLRAPLSPAHWIAGDAHERGQHDQQLRAHKERVQKALDKMRLLIPHSTHPDQQAYQIEPILSADFPWVPAAAGNTPMLPP